MVKILINGKWNRRISGVLYDFFESNLRRNLHKRFSTNRIQSYFTHIVFLKNTFAV